jgi:hypothetical protein
VAVTTASAVVFIALAIAMLAGQFPNPYAGLVCLRRDSGGIRPWLSFIQAKLSGAPTRIRWQRAADSAA